ncbi:paraquat-inducible protein A [Neptunicella sp. SCSIO 80796]|uniref:paraquat-inducible protein A n=1 Tax=Neptunicella plasticusilytica TaxID=3117012 RepID=UPI003A4E5F68
MTQILCPQCSTVQDYQQPQEGESLQCCCCEHVLVKTIRGNNLPALILTLSALILYVPANIYPIMTMTYLGRSNDTTIMGGIIDLYTSGMYGLAALVFTVSIVIPIVKILLMLYLLLVSPHVSPLSHLTHHKLWRFVERIGPWSMLDVFLVAILVALVKLQDMARVDPGPGIVAFAGVVVLTLIASQVLDSRLLWKNKHD